MACHGTYYISTWLTCQIPWHFKPSMALVKTTFTMMILQLIFTACQIYSNRYISLSMTVWYGRLKIEACTQETSLFFNISVQLWETCFINWNLSSRVCTTITKYYFFSLPFRTSNLYSRSPPNDSTYSKQ